MFDMFAFSCNVVHLQLMSKLVLRTTVSDQLKMPTFLAELRIIRALFGSISHTHTEKRVSEGAIREELPRSHRKLWLPSYGTSGNT